MSQQCFFKKNNVKHIDYKDTETLRRFLTPTARLMPGKRGGVCKKNQRALALAVKRARYMGLLPYIQG